MGWEYNPPAFAADDLDQTFSPALRGQISITFGYSVAKPGSKNLLDCVGSCVSCPGPELRSVPPAVIWGQGKSFLILGKVFW